jgi:adenylate cyclase
MDRFRETKLVLLSADLAGFTAAVTALEPVALAEFLDAYYRRAGASVTHHGGRVVKFMGDACFAVFPEERCLAAVDCAMELASEPEPLPGAQLAVTPGVNVHLGVVAEGELGEGEGRRYDVVGGAVNQLFRMGSGPGLRISEPVYDRLPVGRRAACRRQTAPATYALDLGAKR